MSTFRHGFDYIEYRFNTTVEATTARTLSLSDASRHIEFTNTSASIVTIPSSTSVSLADGAWVAVIRRGTGAVSITTGTNVTLNSKSSGRILSHQYGVATLYKSSANSWIGYGDLSTV